MTYQEAIQYLNSLINFEFKLHEIEQKDFTLDGFRRLLFLLGDPQRKLKCVHIAGSKGKGSTAILTAEMLRAAGYRVGLYTSPHLYDVRERIRILSPEEGGSKELFPGCISQDDFVRVISDIAKIVQANAFLVPTYFEVLTAAAFCYFYGQNVDCVVLETGLGGRLDATNVVRPLVCGITLIDLEHTHILGETLGQVSREKAGIIKSGCLGVVCAPQPAKARQVIEDKCRHEEVDVFFVDKHDGKFEHSEQVLAEFQKVNIAVAEKIVQTLMPAGFNVGQQAIEQTVRQTCWPVRMEVISRDPIIILDGAHTGESSRLVAESIRRNFPDRRILLILGMSVGKDQCHIAEYFARMADMVILTRSSHERADPLDDPLIGAIFTEHGTKVLREDDLKKAVLLAMGQRKGNDIIVAAGSIFLAAEARRYFIEKGMTGQTT